MGAITLLSSYPKSGNTWVRAFLTGIWRAQQRAALNINDLMIQSISSKEFIDPLLGLPSAELSHAELEGIRPDLCDLACRQAPAGERLFLKTHDALLPGPATRRLPFSADALDRILYIVRDPRGVAPSFARHLGTSIDATIARMADAGFLLSSYPGRVGHHVRQLLSSWSAHVDSWMDNAAAPLLIVRFEDMASDPSSAFRKMLAFLEVNADTSTIDQVLDATRLSALQSQEARLGFREKTAGGHNFFHSGQPYEWKTLLSPQQVDALIMTHERTMRRLGYLS